MTIANDHTVMNNANVQANWSTGGAAAPDSPTLNNAASTVPIYVDDGNVAAMNFPLKKDASGYTFTTTIPANFDASGGGIFMWWVLYLADVYAIPIEYLALRFSSATGFTTNFREWKFIDSIGGDAQEPELLEGWTPCRVYPEPTTADGDNSNGTLNTADIESIGIVIEAGATADGKFGGFDKCIYISEMQMHSSITQGLFEMFSDTGNGSRPNRLGVVENAGAFYKFNVNIRIGDSAATAITTLTESGVTIFFDNVETEHALGFKFESNVTYATNFDLSASSVFWTDQESTAEIYEGVENLDSFKVDGVAHSNGGKCILAAHISDALTYLTNSNFTTCQRIEPSTMKFDGNSISDTAETAATSGALLIDSTSHRVTNCNFTKGTAASHAIVITTPGTYTLDGHTFNGYNAVNGNADSTIRNESGGAVTINASNITGNLTYQNGTGASTTINNNVTVTFAGLKDNTEVRVYRTSDGVELDGIENATAGTADNRTFAASIAASVNVYYVIHNVAYEYIQVNNFTWPATAQTINVQQRLDRNYNNPV